MLLVREKHLMSQEVCSKFQPYLTITTRAAVTAKESQSTNYKSPKRLGRVYESYCAD